MPTFNGYKVELYLFLPDGKHVLFLFNTATLRVIWNF